MDHVYRFTIRPASGCTCPEGWTSIDPLVPNKPWNYGTATYPAPLTREQADHYSLTPVNNEVPKLWWEGKDWYLGDILGPDGADLAYLYGSATIDRAEFERRLTERLEPYRELGEYVEIRWAYCGTPEVR